MNFSLIIPVCNDLKYLKILINEIEHQSIKPNEIILVDSSTNNKIYEYYNNLSSNLKIIYRSYFNNYYFKIGYPGLSRNIGSNLAKNETILFLDTKTIPSNEKYFETNLNYFYKKNKDYLIGKTKFIPNNTLQENHYFSSYGELIYNTVPGTFVKKSFIKNNPFKDNLRAGEDLEWKIRINAQNKNENKNYDNYLIYSDHNRSLLKLIRKYILYSFHSAKTDIQINTKHLYLSLFLLLTLLIIPRWNFLIGGWSSNPLYIPNITKIYFICIILFMLLNILVNNIIYRGLYEGILSKTLKILTLIIISYCILKWNAFFASFVESSAFIIPHITKIYLVSIIVILIFYRGIYKPLSNLVLFKNIFPIKFLLIGTLGLLLDIVKMPGYIFGAFISMFRINN